MSSVTRFVGWDDHQDAVQVCVMDGEGQPLAIRSVDNRWQAIVAVLEDAAADTEEPALVKASIESCSGAAHLAEELIERAGWAVTLAHPDMVNRMKQNPDKTDASILADLMRLGDRNGLPHHELRASNRTPTSESLRGKTLRKSGVLFWPLKTGDCESNCGP
jgi:hypothetical protein